MQPEWKGRLSETASSDQVKIEVDRLYIEINQIDKQNARIKRKLENFGALDKMERKETRSLLQSNLKQS